MPRVAIRDYPVTLRLNGTTDYVQGPALPSGSGLTLMAWCKTFTPVPGSEMDIFGRSAGASDLLGITSTGTIRFNTALGGNINVTSTITIGDRRWHHIVGTVDATSGVVSIYFDNVLVASGSNSGTFNNPTVPWVVGALTSSTRLFNGLLADAAIFNRALSASDVSRIYLNGIRSSDLPQLYYPFNEGAGLTTFDYSGNGYHGLASSAVVYSSDVPRKARTLVNPNLIMNGSFEFAAPLTAPTTANSVFIDGSAAGSTTNKFFGYHISGLNSFAGSFDSTVSFSGRSSMKISLLSVNSKVECRTNLASGYFPAGLGYILLPNMSYDLSFRMKTEYLSGDAASGAFIQMMRSDAAGNNSSESSTVKIKATTDWTYYTASFTTTALQTLGHLELRVYGNDGAATLLMNAWFDDIVLKPTIPVTRLAVV